MSVYRAENEAKQKGANEKKPKKPAAKDSDANKASARDPLRIIGPTFSGSLYSLAQLLKNLPPKAPFDGVVIRSGTVSSWNTTHWFAKLWNECGLKVDFATFQHSDKYLLRKFIEFEKRRGYQPNKIAVLAEDETAYGNLEHSGSDNAAAADDSKKCKPSPDRTEDAAREGQERDLLADEARVLQLYFPRDISQLRSQYQQGLSQKEASSSDAYKIRSYSAIESSRLRQRRRFGGTIRAFANPAFAGIHPAGDRGCAAGKSHSVRGSASQPIPSTQFS
jgi:hypothetical protein